MKKLTTILLFALMILVQNSGAAEKIPVKITKDIPYITTKDSGQEIVIKRIQDTDYRLTDDYTKTSRPCPPFCIQPTEIDPGIKNIEELELLDFMKTKLPSKTGIVVDARLKSWFELETIPSAINIPFTTLQNASKKKIEKIFKILGMKVKKDGSWDFTNAKDLAIFCNGVWCEQSKHFVDAITKYHYPKEKLYYYRSGFQGWKLLGLTTVVHKSIEKK